MDSAHEASSRIESETQYEVALRALSKRSRPPRFLRLLMQGLEAYRQSRRMGWSRKHNKYGVRTFATFKMGPRMEPFLSPMEELSRLVFPQLDPSRRKFLDELMKSKDLMGFLFFQEMEQNGDRFESVTLSIGRVVPGNKRFRDRVDLILDAPIVDQEVAALSRVRLYVDPFVEHSPSELVSTDIPVEAHILLSDLSDFYRKNRDDAALAWDHWTQDYIDYFGPRLQAVRKTRFPTALDDAYVQSAVSQSNSIVGPGSNRRAGAA